MYRQMSEVNVHLVWKVFVLSWVALRLETLRRIRQTRQLWIVTRALLRKHMTPQEILQEFLKNYLVWTESLRTRSWISGYSGRCDDSCGCCNRCCKRRNLTTEGCGRDDHAQCYDQVWQGPQNTVRAIAGGSHLFGGWGRVGGWVGMESQKGQPRVLTKLVVDSWLTISPIHCFGFSFWYISIICSLKCKPYNKTTSPWQHKVYESGLHKHICFCFWHVLLHVLIEMQCLMFFCVLMFWTWDWRLLQNTFIENEQQKTLNTLWGSSKIKGWRN